MNLGAPAVQGSAPSRALSHLGTSTSSRCPPAVAATSGYARSGRGPVPPLRRGIACTATAHHPAADLLTIRGVGPKNATLLRAQRINSIDRLQEIYHTTLKKDKAELLRYLTHVVGFRNPAHCRSVADHLDDMDYTPAPVHVKLAVEGNIGAGKSTFLDILCDGALEMQDIIEVVPEPVDEWRSVRTFVGEDAPINLLDRFYKDPMKYAYTFQHYVLLTRMQKDREARASSKPLRVLERSIFSDRMVFVRAMHDAGFMGDLELSVYDSWFSMEIAQDNELTPDGFIYLKAKPETCIKRLRGRNRSEEAGVDADYLRSLHEKHESWLHFGARQLDDILRDQSGASGLVQTVSSLQHRAQPSLHLSPQLAATSIDGRSLKLDVPEWGMIDAAPASIKDNIVFLNSGAEVGGDGTGHIAQALAGVPALVLDHDQEDIMYDHAARLDYASKVKAFSEYVQSLKGRVRPAVAVQRTDGISASDIDSLRHFLVEAKRFVEVEKKNSERLGRLGGDLMALEGLMGRLAQVKDEGGLDRLLANVSR